MEVKPQIRKSDKSNLEINSYQWQLSDNENFNIYQIISEEDSYTIPISNLYLNKYIRVLIQFKENYKF